jgi:hypothetical protein
LYALGVLFCEGDEASTHSLMEIQGFLVKAILVPGLLSSGQPLLGREIEEKREMGSQSFSRKLMGKVQECDIPVSSISLVGQG